MVYNDIPDLSHIKKIGCLPFTTTSIVQRTKLNSRARKCVFLGYKDGVKGFTLFDMNKKNIFVTRDVIFYENYFRFYKDTLIPIWTHDMFKHLLPFISDNDIVMPTFVGDIVPSIFYNNIVVHIFVSDIVPLVYENVIPSSLPATDSSTPLHLIDNDVLQHQHSDPQPSSVRVSTCLKQPPGYLKDHHTTFFSSKYVTNHSSSTKYPIQNYISYHNCSPTYSSFCHNIYFIQEPKSFKEVIQHDCWKEAMQHEFDALKSNKTWSLMDLPPRKRPIGRKWVFKAKHKPNDTIDRYKARLGSKGYTQTEGIEYFETFSPVVKITTIQFILSLASAEMNSSSTRCE